MPLEIKQLRGALFRVTGCFFLLTFLAFSLSVQWVHVWLIALPWPAGIGESVAGTFIQSIRTDLLPAGTTLAVSNPIEAFIVTIGIAAAAGGAVTLFFVAYEMWKFMRPGLYPAERKGLLFIFLAAMALLIGGAKFAYNVLVPAVYTGLYGFLPSNVLPIFSLSEVVWQVIGMMLATAVAFLLPVGMFLLTASTLVPVSFWRSHARHAFFITLIVSAFITPDGSGVSMFILAVPICILYAIGYTASAYFAHYRRKKRAA